MNTFRVMLSGCLMCVVAQGAPGADPILDISILSSLDALAEERDRAESSLLALTGRDALAALPLLFDELEKPVDEKHSVYTIDHWNGQSLADRDQTAAKCVEIGWSIPSIIAAQRVRVWRRLCRSLEPTPERDAVLLSLADRARGPIQWRELIHAWTIAAPPPTEEHAAFESAARRVLADRTKPDDARRWALVFLTWPGDKRSSRRERHLEFATQVLWNERDAWWFMPDLAVVGRRWSRAEKRWIPEDDPRLLWIAVEKFQRAQAAGREPDSTVVDAVIKLVEGWPSEEESEKKAPDSRSPEEREAEDFARARAWIAQHGPRIEAQAMAKTLEAERSPP